MVRSQLCMIALPLKIGPPVINKGLSAPILPGCKVVTGG